MGQERGGKKLRRGDSEQDKLLQVVKRHWFNKLVKT